LLLPQRQSRHDQQRPSHRSHEAPAPRHRSSDGGLALHGPGSRQRHHRLRAGRSTVGAGFSPGEAFLAAVLPTDSSAHRAGGWRPAAPLRQEPLAEGPMEA